MNALYSLEGPHDAEAMERNALKRGKNFVRRDWTREPKERVRSKVTPRNLGVGLNVRGVGIQDDEGWTKDGALSRNLKFGAILVKFYRKYYHHEINL